jgi:hypothetical protein
VYHHYGSIRERDMVVITHGDTRILYPREFNEKNASALASQFPNMQILGKSLIPTG